MHSPALELSPQALGDGKNSPTSRRLADCKSRDCPSLGNVSEAAREHGISSPDCERYLAARVRMSCSYKLSYILTRNHL